MNEIHESKGRFLQRTREAGMAGQVSEKVARSKVSQAFRTTPSISWPAETNSSRVKRIRYDDTEHDGTLEAGFL
jgi:hypothetical protein